MPIYKSGNMWSVLREVHHFLITTNSTVKANGELVMGAGIAKQARDNYPGLAAMFGGTLQLWYPDGKAGCVLYADNTFGMFQVKYDWKQPADLDLIQYSTDQLKEHALKAPHQRFALNFPGIACGGLPYEQVKPIVDALPDNVQIWTY